jgi:hypothetical protein
VATHTLGLSEFWILLLAFNHIWLNFHKNDCNYFHIFLWMMATLQTRKVLKKDAATSVGLVLTYFDVSWY